MIRKVDLGDTEVITAVYNEYVINGMATFKAEPVTIGDMCRRITQISANFPCFVYGIDNEVVGYCYAHLWKERVAYQYTLETTIYLSTEHIGKGIRRLLIQKLMGKCRKSGYHTLIVCITKGNETSYALHVEPGFKQVAGYKQVGRRFNRWLGVVGYELLLIPQLQTITERHSF